jgi:hypothetical protein
VIVARSLATICPFYLFYTILSVEILCVRSALRMSFRVLPSSTKNIGWSLGATSEVGGGSDIGELASIGSTGFLLLGFFFSGVTSSGEAGGSTGGEAGGSEMVSDAMRLRFLPYPTLKNESQGERSPLQIELPACSVPQLHTKSGQSRGPALDEISLET